MSQGLLLMPSRYLLIYLFITLSLSSLCHCAVTYVLCMLMFIKFNKICMGKKKKKKSNPSRF